MNDIFIISMAYFGFAAIHSVFSTNAMKNWYRKIWPAYFAFYRITFNILQTILLLIILIISFVLLLAYRDGFPVLIVWLPILTKLLLGVLIAVEKFQNGSMQLRGIIGVFAHLLASANL